MDLDPSRPWHLIEQLSAAETQLGLVPDESTAVSILLRTSCESLHANAVFLVSLNPAGAPRATFSFPAGMAEIPEVASALIRMAESVSPTATTSPERLPPDSAAEFLSHLDASVGERSAVYAERLVLRTGLLGHIFFLIRDDPGHQDLTLMSLLGARMATALEVARLHDSAIQQATELGMFHEAAAAAGERPAVPGLLQQVTERAVRVTPYESAVIFLVDHDRTRLSAAAVSGIPGGRPPIPSFRIGEGAPGWIAATGESVRMETPAVGADVLAKALGIAGIRRFLALPMIWQQDVLGVLALASYHGSMPVGEVDLRLARIVAYQAASALGLARLIESEREQRSMAQALELASLSISRLDVDQVLDGILEQVMRVFPCDAANFMTLHGTRSHIARAVGYDAFGLTHEYLQGATLSTTVHATLARMLDGTAMVVEDTLNEPAWVQRSGLEWIRSWAGAPIRFGDTLLGFLNLDSARPGAFDAEAARRLAAFAAHAAAAIHNARTYEALQLQHSRLEQVHRIGNAIAGTLHPDQIEHELVRGLQAAAPVTHVAAYRCEGADRTLTCSTFAHADPSPERTASWAHGSDLALQSIEAGSVLEHRDVVDGIPQTVVTVPLAAAGRPYGAIGLWMEPEASIDDSLLDALAAIGQQAGLALANADRHAQVQRRLAEMTLLQNVVGAVAQRLEVDAVLTEVTEQLHTSLGFPAVQFFLREGEEIVLTRVSGPYPVMQRARLDRGIVGRVVRTGQPAYVPDVRADPDYLAALVGTRAEMCVPVRQGDEVIGAINIETSDPGQLDPGVLELLGMLADQLSIALHNATLYEQIRTHVTTLEARVRERTTQLQGALERAQDAERAKALFVADVSHELRTPLTNIGLYLDLLEIGADERRPSYMATLRRETERLGTLIEQLLTISNLDAQQVPVSIRAIDLNELTQVLLGDRERLIRSRGLVLETYLQPDLPHVLADPRLLMQVMTNLLSNATQYTPSGGTIVIRTATRERDGLTFGVFSVRDTGPGVPPEEQERIFDRFYRGSTGRASGAAGTGLGLAIAREVMGQHHGDLTLSSEPGQGAEFTAWIPIA